MCKVFWLAASLFMSLAIVANTAHADDFPTTSVDSMCDEAELIIEGEYLGNNKVRITRVHKQCAELPAGTKELTIHILDKHDRSLGAVGWRLPGEARTDLETKQVVLFLERGAEGWQSLSTIDDKGACGSCGLFWFDAKGCYGYDQLMNPGPYNLVTAKDSLRRVPANIEALRKDIEVGLTNSKRWRETLVIKDPKEKAKTLTAYLLPRTSPPGDKGTYLGEARDPLRELGDDAVPALVEILKNARPDDQLNPVVLSLYDLGPKSKSAAPLLCKLLGAPKQASTGYVLSALERAADPQAIEHVRPFLKNETFSVAVKAARALAVLKDKESFESIAALIPEKAEQAHQSDLRDLLNALHLLDPERARPIIAKAAEQPALSAIKSQIEGLKGSKE